MVYLDEVWALDTEVASELGRVNADRMQYEERWGDLASIAIFIAERGWFTWAKGWSALIPDKAIAPIHEGRTDLAHQRMNGYRTQCAYADDARVLAPLALIDFLAGYPASAAYRIARSDVLEYDLGISSWWFAGHRALIDWVRSRLLSEAGRGRQLLETIDPRHSWLVLHRAQISSDLAGLAAEAGDFHRASGLRKLAMHAMSEPNVELHVGIFPYDRLLNQLPIVTSGYPGHTQRDRTRPHHEE